MPEPIRHTNLHLDRSRLLHKLRNLVEVHVAIDFGGLGVHQLDLLHVLRHRHDAAGQGAHRGQFGGAEVDAGVDAQAVREVAGRGGDRRRTLADLRLVAHAQRAARHFHAGTGLAEHAVVTFFGQDQRIHLGRRGDPQAGRNIRLAFEDLAGGAEVADVGHARTDENFVDLVAGDFGQQLDVVRIVRAGQDRLGDFGQVDFDHGSVLGVSVGLEQRAVGDPLFHGVDAALQGAGIGVAFGNHPLHQGDVRTHVLDDRFLVQGDRAGSGGTLGGGVGEFEGLFNLEVRQAFDFQDAAGEDVLLALLLDGQQAGLDGVVRNGIDQVTQSDAVLHLALEADQHRFRHVQRHDAGGGGKGDQTGTGREGDADRETGMRVTAGTNGIRQQQAVQPGVDDAVARTQRNAATGADEGRQFAVHAHVDQLRISSGVAEGLHDQIGGEAEAGQILQFVAGHRAGGVLRTDGGHLRLAVGTRQDAGNAAGLADHLLGQRVTLAVVGRVLRQAEQGRLRQAEEFTGLGGQAATDDQGDTTASTDFVEDDEGLQLRFGNHVAVLDGGDLAGGLVDLQFDLVAHVHLAGVDFDRQGAGIFHRVEEDRGDLGTQADAAETLVRDERDVFAGKPQHGVGSGLAGRTGTDHVTNVGDQVALLGQSFELLDRAARARLVGFDTRTRVLQHGQRMQRDVRTRPGIRRRRQVVGIGFAGDLEHGQLLRSRHSRARGEPLAIGPGLHDDLGVGVAGLGQFGDIVEEVEHQQGLLQAFGGDGAAGRAGEQVDQRLDVVAAEHRAEQFGSLLAGNQRTGFFALGDLGQELSLDLGGIIDASRHAVGDQFDQGGFFAGRRVLQQGHQFGGLLLGQGQRRDTEGCTLCYVGAIGFKHGDFLS